LIHNDTFWKDTSGTPIYSQGGGVFTFNGTYYWYGVKYNGAVSYAANTKKNSDTSFAAITCYSSTDLATWKHENDVLTTASLGANVDSGTWIGRMGVVYNATTKKYVLISQYQGGPAGTGELFATSDTPTGTFTFDHVQAVSPTSPTRPPATRRSSPTTTASPTSSARRAAGAATSTSPRSTPPTR
jgi:hypothetical protein